MTAPCSSSRGDFISPRSGAIEQPFCIKFNGLDGAFLWKVSSTLLGLMEGGGTALAAATEPGSG
jgi:hypothetical protein